MQDDLADEPVSAVLDQNPVDRQHVFDLARGAQQHEPDQRLVQTQMQERVVQLAVRAQGPVRVAELLNPLGRRRQLAPRPAHGQLGVAPLAVQLQGDVPVLAPRLAHFDFERVELYPRAGLDAPPGPLQNLTDARLDALLKLARREVAVDQPPLLRALRLQALGQRREHVGAVAPHLALVDQTR